MLTITKQQIFQIRKNCGFNEEIKEECVQWVTGDNSRTSLKTLSYDEANKIIAAQTGKPAKTENWAYFDKRNEKHRVILSLLRQAGWTVPNERHGTVPDLERFSNFLKGVKSPVKKPLKKMIDTELEKTIVALRGIVGHTYKKKK